MWYQFFFVFGLGIAGRPPPPPRFYVCRVLFQEMHLDKLRTVNSRDVPMEHLLKVLIRTDCVLCEYAIET